jgi:hypothetical protein
MFLDHVAPWNISSYAPRRTQEYNQTYVPRGTEEYN